MKKIMLYLLVVTAGIFGTGCTAGEIGAGAIGIGIGIGIGRGHHHGDGHRHRRPPRHRCDYDHFGRRHCWDGMDQIYAVTKAADTSELSSRYRIPMTSAAKITDAFEQAETGELTSFKAMGLDEKAVKAMLNHRLPSDSTVKTVSAKLNLSETQGRNMLVSMMREYHAQAANVNSDYWKYCMAEGFWKTNKNRSCSKAHWPGCSPATGASFCY